ncbi:MAG: AlpA family phage regulatory protein [Gammaproteobacteria bacterium]
MTAPKNRKILRIADVSRVTGLTRSGIYKGCREKWFPQPIPLTPTKPGRRAAASGWLEDEVAKFIAERVAVRDGERAVP